MCDPNNAPTPLFIFSLPRSGSTLSQRILAAHKDIATVSESHILLPYLFTLKNEGVYSEYNHQYTVRGIKTFCLSMPNGVDDYLAEIRTFVLRLYAKTVPDNAKYFVDKAGAYHLVVEDIIRLFPEGKFIFLWRNPLAVVSSLMQSWYYGRWKIYKDEIRLFKGIEQLVHAYQKYSNQVHMMRYEDLITNPYDEWEKVFKYLGLSFDPTVLTGFSQVHLKGNIADQPGMKRYHSLSQEPLEKWKTALANPVRKAWCYRYLKWIGRERLAIMGYDLDSLLAEIDAIPFSLHFLGSDFWHIPYGVVYRVFEGSILKHKLVALRSGNRVYAHR